MNKEDYFKYYIQGSDHYLIPKDVFNELFDEMSNWREEVKELKRQLKKKNKPQIFIETQDMEERYAEGLYQDYLEEENHSLKKQLDYLRNGEYYNQLRFENEMLQQLVDTNGVSSEVYNYIKCNHRNTELLEENQKYKEVIDKAIDLIEKSVTTDIGIDSNNIIHYHQLTEDETGELLEILKEVE